MKTKSVKAIVWACFFLLLRIDISIYDIGHDIPKFIHVVSSIFLIASILFALYAVLSSIFDKEDTNGEKKS